MAVTQILLLLHFLLFEINQKLPFFSPLKELQAHTETITRELEDLKQMHNYMMQMQTVINQRAMEAPSAKEW